MLLELQGWQGDLAWLIECGTTMRLVMVRDGVPKLDCSLRFDDPADLLVALRARIAAWQTFAVRSRTLAGDFRCLRIGRPHGQPQPLRRIESLALSGMAKDIYPLR